MRTDGILDEIDQGPFAGLISDPQSLNPYVYVENTSTSCTDPSGQDPFGFLVGLVVGAAIALVANLPPL